MDFKTKLQKTGSVVIQGIATTISFEHEEGKIPERIAAHGNDSEGMNINSSYQVATGKIEIQIYGASTAPVEFLAELEAQFNEIKASFEPIN